MKEYEHDDRVMPFILDDKAKTLGDKMFVRHKEDRVTYGELSEASNRVANTFTKELGVKKGDNIAVLLPNCVDFFYTQFGIAKSAAIMVPINLQARLDLLAYFIDHSDAQIVVIDEQYIPSLEAIEDRIPKVNTLVVRTPEFKRDKFAFSRQFNIVPYQELFSGSATDPKPDIHFDEPVDIFYTSGTTGVSKGVVLPYNHHYMFGLLYVHHAHATQ